VNQHVIVTLTLNPSLDRTIEVDRLVTGAVIRATSVRLDPGGKGVNVSRALAAAGAAVVSVLPAPDDDPLLGALRRLGLLLATVPVRTPVRTNYTVAEPDGTTTKLNEPGAALDEATRTALAAALRHHAEGARWVVLSGSLPPGTPPGWYAELVGALRGTGARIAVDTSGEPLRALLDGGDGCAPDLLKPNAAELAELAGTREDEVLADPDTAAAAVRSLHRRGVGEVLLTLGADGALLSTAEGIWTATPPRVAVRSTVGAGDCSLAGYLLADLAGGSPPDRLRSAVAYGAASAGLPGSAVPTPAQVDGAAVRVTAAPRTTPHPVPAAGRDVR
jgi:1-phosphofructokinase